MALNLHADDAMARVRAIGILLDVENDDGTGFRVWDVTKNVISQHNQTALTKFGCARAPYSYLCPKFKI